MITASKSAARLLIVGGGPFQLDLIQTALGLGAHVIVVDKDPLAPGASLAQEAFAIDTSDIDAVVGLARDRGVDGVATAASDAALEALGAVVEACHLEGPDLAVIRTCRDKLATFSRVRSAGLLVPETRLVSAPEEARVAAEALGGYPVVIKPRSSAGGRGVTILQSDEEIPDAMDLALRHSPRARGVLVQDFVDGVSIGVEAFFHAGELVRAFVLNDQLRPDFVSPVGHSLPSRLEPARVARFVEAVQSFARAVGFSQGPVNFDFRQDGEEVVLIEINPRLGGNSITELVRVATGADLSLATVQAALGRAPEALGADPAASAGRRPPRPAASRLLMVRGLGAVRLDRRQIDRYGSTRDVEWLRLFVEDGAPARFVVNGWSLVGGCLVSGDTLASAEALAEEVAATVEAGLGVEP